MTDTPDLVREAFEAWADAQGLSLLRYKDDGPYKLYSTRGFWTTWQACDAQHRAALAEMEAAGTEAMRRAVCAWLRVSANALKKLGKDNSLLVEVHNAVLKMDATPNPGASHAG